MGPLAVGLAQGEVRGHGRVTHDWGGQDIVWRAGSRAQPLDLAPQALLPLDLQDRLSPRPQPRRRQR